MTLNIATIGNPNSGKTTLFNELTGSNQQVGNWSGVTVEKKTGHFTLKNEQTVKLIDLPGIYNIDHDEQGSSLDERVAFDYIMKNEPEDHLSAAVSAAAAAAAGAAASSSGASSPAVTSVVAAEYFVSPNAKCLAEKVDYIYCHSNEFDTRDDLEERINECAVLFDFLMDKDIFIDFHTYFLAQRLLGKNVSSKEKLHVVVPAGSWFSMTSSGLYSLIGCTVSPGFSYSDFELAPPDWEPLMIKIRHS